MEIPHESLIKDIEAGNYPFIDCHVMGPHGLKLFLMELDRCQELYAPYEMPNANAIEVVLNFYGLHQQIILIEEPHRKDLADLGKELVYDFFGIPNEFEMNSQIIPNITPDLDFEIPKVHQDDLKRLSEHIKKRRLIDAITHGGAVYLWKTLHFLGENQIKAIEPELFNMYSAFSANAEILKFSMPFLKLEDVESFAAATQMNEDMNPINGFNYLEFEDNKTKVNAHARNFVLLLHEQIKGVLETLSLHGIDQSLSAEDLDIVFQITGNYREEQFHYFFGPSLWSIILEKEGLNPHEIPNFLKELYVLNYNEMVDYFNSYLETK